MRDIVLASETILDVLARDGQHTLLCSRTNPHCNIYSFEPETRFFSLLEKNVREHGAKNVTILQNAVGSRSRIAQVGPEDDQEDVEMITIDSLNLVGCDYIRIGGAARPVLLGGINTIKRFRPSIMLEEDSQGAKSLLENMGYKFDGGLATSLRPLQL